MTVKAVKWSTIGLFFKYREMLVSQKKKNCSLKYQLGFELTFFYFQGKKNCSLCAIIAVIVAVVLKGITEYSIS